MIVHPFLKIFIYKFNYDLLASTFRLLKAGNKCIIKFV